jgi:hypothetical protein
MGRYDVESFLSKTAQVTLVHVFDNGLRRIPKLPWSIDERPQPLLVLRGFQVVIPRRADYDRVEARPVDGGIIPCGRCNRDSMPAQNVGKK